MKKFLSYLLTFSLVFSSMSITFAEEESEQETVAREFVAEEEIPEEETAISSFAPIDVSADDEPTIKATLMTNDELAENFYAAKAGAGVNITFENFEKNVGGIMFTLNIPDDLKVEHNAGTVRNPNWQIADVSEDTIGEAVLWNDGEFQYILNKDTSNGFKQYAFIAGAVGIPKTTTISIYFATEDDSYTVGSGAFDLSEVQVVYYGDNSPISNLKIIQATSSEESPGDDEAAEKEYEEISTYSDYETLEEQFLNGEDFTGRYFKISGEIIDIGDGYFGIAMDSEGNSLKISGAVSPDYLNYNATIYCSTDEKRDFFLCMTDIEYGDKNTVEIMSEEDLKNINSESSKTYELKNDIVLSENWTPIEFNGVLEGNGYTISGLNVVSDQEYSYDYAGLFSVNNGTIRNLNVKTTESGVLSLRGGTATAGIIAGLNNGTIENCTATGVVAGLNRTGGIAGRNSGTVNECYAAAVMKGAYSYQGGLIGYNTGTVTNSHALANITASNYSGGLIGQSSGSISNCYSEGAVSGSSCIGGLVGNNYAQISNSYSTCNVIGSDSIGGLLGYNNANISNCHASGSIVGSSSCVGGLIGRASYGDLSDCYFTGSVKSTSEQVGGLIGTTERELSVTDCYARATIQGTYYVGGLIGYAHYSPNIIRCYTGGGIIASGQSAGGLVGRYYSYNRSGRIELSFSNADVWGSSYVGGLIGTYVCGNYSLNVKNCYSTGAVDGSNYVGGLIGYQNDGGHFYNSYAVGKIASASNSGGITGWRSGISSALIEKCYYDTEATGKGTSENGIGKTTAKMKTEENYLTWDFDTVWAIDSSVNNGYPYLKDNYNINTDSTIVINTEEDLRHIADNLSGNYILNDNIELTDDWSMVGDSNLAFYGTFDGNGYTISNFNMNGNAGAFIHSVAVSGVVKNLNIEMGTGVNVTGNAAGIAINNYGTIDNCTVNGKITSSGSSSVVGGIVAYNYAEINDCHTKTSLKGGQYTGGIVGCLSKGSVKGCSAVGSAIGGKYVGGAVGYMDGGKVAATASAGIVRCSNTSDSDQASGGLIGRINHEYSNSVTLVEECGSTADVSGYYFVGGLVGYMRGYSNSSYVKYIKNCYSNGNVSGSNCAGNFVGEIDYYWTFQNCYIGGKSTNSNISSYNSGYVKQSNCFYMNEYSGGGLFTGKKQEMLKNRDTFENWDFDNVWAIDPSINGAMPYLKNAPALNDDDTYILIRSESDFDNISNDLTAKYRLATDITVTSPHKMLGTFEGILDGSGFTITNKTADEDGTVYPIFGTIAQSGKVKNLVVDTAVDMTKTNNSAGGLTLVNNGTIENVTVKGSVKGTNSVGGIAARNNGYIYNSHSEANVEGVNYVGGIAGWNVGDIVKSSAKGKVTSSGTDAGGIAGRFTGGCIKYAASYAVVYGKNNVGGVAGYMDGYAYVRYSYSKGEVGTLQQSGECFGGLVGQLYRTNQAYPIMYSYSDAVIKGYNNVGGLIGYFYNYSSTTYFNNCYVSGEIAGNGNVGMMVGYYNCYNNYNHYFRYCYSAAKVGGIYALPNNSYLSSVNSYFNTATAGKQSDAKFTALTDEQFKTKDSFKNWDFDTVWDISPDKNNGYPYLRELGTDDYAIEDTYEYTLIHNEEELFKIRKDLNGKYKLANNIEITEPWQPIGDGSKSFNGILDGNGFKISNFYILQNEEYEYTLAGMFGYIGRLGEVKNLTVETSDYGVATLNSGKVAGIIAADNYGKINNCHVKGNVKATDAAGGIAARNYGRIINSAANVNITNSSTAGGVAGYNSGNIQNTSVCGNIKSSSDNVGGITGSNNGGYVNNCTAENITVEGKSGVGGIVGYGGTVYKCNANADIKGVSCVGGISGNNSTVAYSEAKCNIESTGERVGGIIGSTGSGVSDSKFIGSITGALNYIGGIAGYTTAAVTDCTSEVDISGGGYIGGIAGYSSSFVMDCISQADITGTYDIGGIVGQSAGSAGMVKNTSSTGTLTGTNQIGGVVGDAGEGTITNSYSDCSISGNENVGGFAGYTNGFIKYSYSFSNVNGKNYVGGFVGAIAEKGNVTLCFAKGNVSGGDYVGGFAGSNSGYMQYNYSIGKVTGIGDKVGGFLGSLNGRILNSYYNSETSGQSDTGKGIPKTTEQMKKESVYVGWDFESVWKMQDDINSGYPYFEGYKDNETKEETITEISDKEGFYAIADNPNGSYKLVKDIELDKTVSCLGTFSGTLDGDGHKIYGFSMNIESGDYVGLFESIRAGGVVKNLTVEYKNITVGDDVKVVGAVTGRNYGTITNCAVSGDISGKQNVGGIAGYNYSVIENSTASGNVFGENNVGGLVGRNYLSINNCHSKANVYGNRYVGGAVGYDSSGFVKMSGATGNVSKNSGYTTNEQLNYIGGLIGYANGTIIDRCLTSNAVSGGSYVGGMVGNDVNVTITMSASSSAVVGSQYIGGFTGRSYKSTMSDCYSAGSVNGNGNYIGGFTGYENNCNISCCYSNCIVEGKSERVGGFVGRTEVGKLENCYSAGSVTSPYYYCGGFVGEGGYNVTYSNCVTDSKVNGADFTGGFMGQNNNSSSVFENCYARGKVTGKSYTYGFAYWNNGPSTFTNCGYDATNNSYSDSYAAGKTAEELAKIDQYKNWDFDKNWILNKDVSEYPYLSWQKAPGDLPTVIPAISVKISSAAYAVNVGEALSMQASLYPANATDKVVWSSSNENVAVVKTDGTVIAVSEGKATITVTAGAASASVEIEVVAQNKSGNIVKVITAPEFTVPYDTEIDEMLVMLPAVVEVMLSTGVVASLEVTWRHTAGTEYEFSGAISVPDNINITNTNNISAAAKITKEPEAIIAKEIVSVPDVSLGVVNGTSLSTVLSMLPESVNVTLDDNSEVSLSVAWDEASEPYYNAFTSGEYVFTGKLVLPGDNSIKNTNGFSIVGKIKVADEEAAVRDITSAMSQNNILIERYTTLNNVLELFPNEVYAVVDNVQTVSLPVTWSSVSEPAYSPRVAGTYTFYGTFRLPEDGTVTNTLNIRPTINVVVSSKVSDEKAITVVGSIAEIGKSAAVSVAIDENTRMASGSIVIDYDAALLTPVSYEIGSVIEETSAMVNINYIDPATHERKIKVSWVGANEINAGGELVKINFLVSEGASDEAEIKVGVEEALIEDMDLNTIPFKTIDGTIKAVSVMLGDVNSDGRISIQDAFRILLMDIGRITFTDKQKLAADVNKDGVIDIFDAMKIQKYDIGLSDTLN